ncbi:MGH1-like glycoside hydrolase domain-containing protein [Arcticibacter tournemirensis]|uniref:Glycoside hydrolase n=1 Tax=Arcticibacter tournemirensis TaxID=699437 RepID=A0A4Q0M3D0_9SPHI|nr:trehalase family glycosidase [Arcticibacter tournemirensis]RXF67345.1 glycoside hydrolase [Arcticibacter tournemirensis]
MKRRHTVLLSVFLGMQVLYAQDKRIRSIQFKELENTHDISTGKWGPYSKQYAGISHIPEVSTGIRFDFSVVPGYYRNKIVVPNVLFESGYFPWDFSSDMTAFTYRYELEWKDKTYVDVRYKILDSATVLASMKCVNATSMPQNITLNLMAWQAYPDIFPAQSLNYPQGSKWINAADYQSVGYKKKSSKDNLVTDGLMRGEIRDAAYIDGSAIRLGEYAGDKVTYKLNFKNLGERGKLSLVYRLRENKTCALTISGIVNESILLNGTGALAITDLKAILPRDLNGNLTIEVTQGAALELNGMLLSAGKSAVNLVDNKRGDYPQIISNPKEKNAILKYKDNAAYYGLAWDSKDFTVREVRNDELDLYFRKLVHNHVDSILNGNNKGHYFNVFIRPVELAPNSERTVYSLICTGSLDQVRGRLNQFKSVLAESVDVGDPIATPGAQTQVLPEGKKYEFSQRLLKSTVLSNVVYPIYTQRQYIRHFTPGKWWNSLYTWDSGFIAIGLNEINPHLVADCINTYTTPVGSQSAFIHHGSPVPVQMYAFMDLWNKSQSKDLLQYFYPRLKQYYQFLAGHSGSSSTAVLRSGLLKTWDYFYNSGGWDDYPAQVGVHRQRAEKYITPVISTAQCIRTAKILRLAAIASGNEKDVVTYDKDIRKFSNALQRFSWNTKSGYFSYVRHDEEGRPQGPFNYTDGQDYNMGLDGAYPLLAGICTGEQEDILIEKLFSERHLTTPSGIGVVDQSAPYYQSDGYWNGSVWMPHQWFMWKTMLDLGHPDLAFKIASKGLEVYAKETDESYYTFEHFFAKTGRGAGWHQFSGLSTPVLSWFSAYYKPGTVTAGFEVWINSQKMSRNNSAYEAFIVFDKATPAHKRSVVACMDPSKTYKATFSGKSVEIKTRYPGLIEIILPASNEEGTLMIEPVT